MATTRSAVQAKERIPKGIAEETNQPRDHHEHDEDDDNATTLTGHGLHSTERGLKME